jgi:SLOG family YspA-like protein
MKVLVCGDRNWTDINKIRGRLKTLPKDAIVIHGAARGADTLGGVAAKELGFEIQTFPAEWGKHGRAAGPIRNRQMLDQKPDVVIAFHSNLAESRGTKDTVTEAKRRGIPVEIIP